MTDVNFFVTIFVKNCHQKPDFMAKIHKNSISAGALTHPAGEAYDGSPDLLIGWGRRQPLHRPFLLNAFGVSTSAPTVRRWLVR